MTAINEQHGSLSQQLRQFSNMSMFSLFFLCNKHLCLMLASSALAKSHTNTHTDTQTCIYIYIYIYMTAINEQHGSLSQQLQQPSNMSMFSLVFCPTSIYV